MFPTRSSRNNLVGSDPDDWSRVPGRGLRTGCGDGDDEDRTWTFGRRREVTFGKLRQRWNNVKRGMDIDVDTGRQSGEKAPDEYWTRVWTDMHRGNGGPPGNLPNISLREKWAELKETGKTDEECWETLEIQYPVAFLGFPLLKRWENLGEGKPMEDTRGEMFSWLEEFNRIFLRKELKDRLEEMRKLGEEDEFWRTNWDVVHRANSKDMRDDDFAAFIFPVHERNENGDVVRVEPKYKHYYPNEFGPRMCCSKSKSIENNSLFRQFDFV